MFIRLVGLAVIITAICFVPINLWRYARGGRLPHGWGESCRRRVVVGGRLITAGYIISGLIVAIFGQAGLPFALIGFGLTHFAYLAVPCLFAFFNRGWHRVVRNSFYVLVGLGCIFLAFQQ